MKFICFASAALAAMSKRDAHMEQTFTQTQTEQCIDSDLYYGWTDDDGDGCWWYYGNEAYCGDHDDDDFWASYDCCACGGGMHNYW